MLRRKATLALRTTTVRGNSTYCDPAAFFTTQAMESELVLPWFLALLAEAYGKEGQTGEGLAVVTEALDAADKSGERFCEAELYRLRGELTFAQSRVQSLEPAVQERQKAKISKAQILNPDAQSEVEACFLKAIETAQKQRAKS